MYLFGTTQTEYAFPGLVTPRRLYSEAEMAAGKKPVVEITAEQEKMLRGNTIAKGLLSSGVIQITSTYPSHVARTPEEHSDAAQAATARADKLEKDLEAANKRIESLKLAVADRDKLLDELRAASNAGGVKNGGKKA